MQPFNVASPQAAGTCTLTEPYVTARVEAVLVAGGSQCPDESGVITLRFNGRLHHIGIGRTHARTHVTVLVRDLNIRVINATTGELLRELSIDPRRNYQPTGRPPGPAAKKK